MRLKNKKTGEIVERVDLTIREEGVVFNNDETYNSLAELNAEWEDYEEPKEHWTIGHDGAIFKLSEWENQKDHEEIGNYFETKEEAENAVEKLKALKRLKDKGFRFVGRTIKDLTITYSFDNYDKSDIPQMNKDLCLLFGGEDE